MNNDLQKKHTDAVKELMSILEPLKETSPSEYENALSLIDDISSLSGQMSVKPVHFCIDEENVVAEKDMGALAVYKMKDGTLEWRTKGGYRAFFSSEHLATCAALETFLLSDEYFEKSTDADIENIEALRFVIQMVMSVPMCAFGDEKLMFDIAEKFQHWMNESLKKAQQPVEETEAEASYTAAFQRLVENEDNIVESINYMDEQFEDAKNKLED